MASDRKAQLKEKAAEEFRLLVLITAYLAAFFAAFLTYRRLISREFGVSTFHYGYALLEALIIAKVILIGKAIGLGRKGTRRTLAMAVLRSSLAYGALVGAFAVLEHLIEGLVHGKTLAASLEAFHEPGRLRDPWKDPRSLRRVHSVLRLLGARPLWPATGRSSTCSSGRTRGRPPADTRRVRQIA